MTTYFDRLPAELLHMIFQFMSNCDIIWSFLGISPYLNALVNNYSWQSFNFKSISKNHFDFICNHMDLERIISLTLSDDLKTPGQVQLFFNRFYLRDFVNLNSLKLLYITNEDIYPILSDLPKLKNLTSLSTECRSPKPLSFGQILNQLKSLQKLSVSHGDMFDHNVTLPLRNLKVLHAGTCNFLELRRLQVIAPSLVSLTITLQANHQLQVLSGVDKWSSLERFDLTLNHDSTTTFNEIQQLIAHFHRLTHLKLNIKGSAEYLADGDYWETCPTIIRLRKFDFIIEFTQSLSYEHSIIEQMLHSFSTFFWLDTKKWYVVATTHNAFTTSCFGDQSLILSTSLPLSTAPDYHWFNSKTKRIKIDKNKSTIDLNKFYNLERLELSEENILLSILNIQQFTYLRHLIIHQNVSNKVLSQILTQNPNINHLTLSQLDLDQLSPLETIHCLHLENPIKIIKRKQIKELCRVFPSVQRLLIHLDSIRLLCYIINGFHRLENAVVQFYEIIKPISYEWLQETTRLSGNTCSFTCRNERNRVLLWINNSAVPTNHLTKGTIQTDDMIQERKSEKCSIQ